MKSKSTIMFISRIRQTERVVSMTVQGRLARIRWYSGDMLWLWKKIMEWWDIVVNDDGIRLFLFV